MQPARSSRLGENHALPWLVKPGQKAATSPTFWRTWSRPVAPTSTYMSRSSGNSFAGLLRPSNPMLPTVPSANRTCAPQHASG